jgi:4'-phosphopantetheinyl transferase EntD
MQRSVATTCVARRAAREGPSGATIERVGAWLAELLRIAPPGVRIGSRRTGVNGGNVAALHDVELAAIAKAIPARRLEFAAGRVLLRELIDRDVAIPVAPDRRPVLPPGVVASLSHHEGDVVAAVAVDRAVVAVGIDLGPVVEFEPDLARIVLRHDEGVLLADLAFVAKEATYKAWSSLGGRMLEHHDVRLVVHGDTFTAEVLGERSFDGWIVGAGGRWAALVVVTEDRR